MAKLIQTPDGKLTMSGGKLLTDAPLPAAALLVPHTGANSDPGDDGFAPGIYGNAGLGAAHLIDDPGNGGTHCVGTLVLRGTVGVPVISALGGPDAGTGAYYLSGLNGLSLMTNGLSYQSPVKPDYQFLVTVQDDAATYTCAVRVSTAAGALIVERTAVFDTAATGAYGYQFPDVPLVSSTTICFSSTERLTIDDPSGNFQVGADNRLYTTPGAALSSRYGGYPVSVGDSGGTRPSQPGTLYIMAEQRPAVRVDLQPVYSTAQPGDVIGTVSAYSEVGVAGLSVVNDRTGAVVLGGSGVLTLVAPLAAGPGNTFTVRAISTSGKTTDQVVLFTVLPGTLLDPSAMTATVAPLLNWYADCLTATRTALTPGVAGMDGPLAWSLQQDFHVAEFVNSGKLDNFQIDPATGVVGTSVQLRADTYQLTLRATNGPQTCIRTFAVPVAAVAGPVIFVGRGMTDTSSAAYQAAVAALGAPAMASELLGPVYAAMCGYGACPAAYAGAHIYLFADADPDYHALQTADYSCHQGLAGPATIEGVPLHGAMPRLGGRYGDPRGGGMDSGGKGNVVLNNGDFVLRNLWWSDVRANPFQGGDGIPSSGFSGCGVRWNATAYGSLLIDNCYFSDCDQGIETGVTSGTVTITNTEIVNCGGVYVGSGATHNAYIGDCYRLTVDNLLSWRTVNGHTLKVRAMNSHIGNSRFFDGERGGASNLLDFPNSGVHVVDGCAIHKGAFAQNPYAVNAFEDTQNGAAPSPENSVTVQNSTFIVNTDPLQVAAGVFMQGIISHVNGHRSTLTATGNKIYGIDPAKFTGASASYENFDGSNSADPTKPIVAESGTTVLAAQPALDLSHPFAHQGGIPARPGPMYYPYDGESRNNYVNSNGVQIDPGSDDIHLSVSGAAAGDTVFTATATGCPYFKGAPQPDARVDPFGPGTAWQVVDRVTAYTGGAFTLAPAGRYAVAPSSDGTSCAVKLAAVLPALVAGTADRVCLRATAPNGTQAQTQVYVALGA